MPEGSDPTRLELDRIVAIGGNVGAGIAIGGGVDGVTASSNMGAVALTVVDSVLVGSQIVGLGIEGSGLTVSGQGSAAAIESSQLGWGHGTPPGAAEDIGIEVRSGAAAEAARVSISASIGAVVADGSLSLRRSGVQGTVKGVGVEPSAEKDAELEVVDSLVATAGGSTEPAALVRSPAADASASLRAVGTTFVARGGSAAVSAEREPGAGPATASLRNSIARHLPGEGASRDLFASGGAIGAGFSSFTTAVAESGGSVPAPGSGANLAGDPLFAAPAADNFALQPGSPLVDRGNPSLVAAGQLDLAGNPRSLDGNGDCVAAPDIGALELTGHPAACTRIAADAVPTVSGLRVTNKVFAPKGKARRAKRKDSHGRAAASAKGKRRKVKRGTTFVYRLSERAQIRIAIERKARGTRVRRKGKARCVRPRKGKRARRCVRWLKAGTVTAREGGGRQSTRFSGRLRGKPLKPGRYRATVVATDSAGQKSKPRRVSFRIVRG